MVYTFQATTFFQSGVYWNWTRPWRPQDRVAGPQKRITCMTCNSRLRRSLSVELWIVDGHHQHQKLKNYPCSQPFHYLLISSFRRQVSFSFRCINLVLTGCEPFPLRWKSVMKALATTLSLTGPMERMCFLFCIFPMMPCMDCVSCYMTCMHAWGNYNASLKTVWINLGSWETAHLSLP